MHFDIRLLSLIFAVTSIVLAIAMFMVWRTLKKEECARDWTISLTLTAVALWLIGLRNNIPDFFSVVLANTLLVLGQSYLYLGVRRFVGLRLRFLLHGLLAAAIFIIWSFLTYVAPDLQLRIILISGVGFLLLFGSARLLWTKAESALRLSMRFTAVVLAVNAFSNALRGGLAYIFINSPDLIRNDNLLNALPFIAYICMNVWLGVGLTLIMGARLQANLRESEKFLQTIIETEPECIKLLASDGSLLLMNRAGLSMIDVDSFEQIKGQCVYPLIAPAYREAFITLTEDVFRGKAGVLEFEAVGLRERHVWLETHGVPLRNDKAEIIALLGITRDVTERKSAEERIQRSLSEKEVLLREIHHRVKNNMQVVSSLLMLQSKYIKDDTVRAIFNESRNRIHSMSLIHEKLYGSEDLAHIDFSDYVEVLVKEISSIYNRPDISFSVKMPGIFLDINVGIPCGLIINELVSNSLKHAFPSGRAGMIFIGLDKSPGGLYVLTVADDGIGFPDNLDFYDTASLGLQLVNTLTAQLNGTLERVGEPGTVFNVTFPIPTVKEDVTI